MGDVKPWIKNLLALAVIAGVALAIFGMVRDGKANAAAGDGQCTSLQTSVTGLLDKTAIPTINGWENTTKIRQNGLMAAHLIINNPVCFDPTAVAAAQVAIGSH